MLVTCWLLIIALLLVIIASFRRSSVYELILISNVFSTVTVLLITLLGFIMKRPNFIDIALVYTLINFMVLLVILKYIPKNNA